DERIEEIFHAPAERDGDPEREGERGADRKADQGLRKRYADVIEIKPAGDAAVERHEYARGRRQNECRDGEQPYRGLPDGERGGDQQKPQDEVLWSAGHSIPPPALRPARMRRT